MTKNFEQEGGFTAIHSNTDANKVMLMYQGDKVTM